MPNTFAYTLVTHIFVSLRNKPLKIVVLDTYFVFQCVALTKSVSCSSLLQVLNCEAFGKVSGFEATPGCGLKCIVSETESLLEASMSDADIVMRRNSVTSTKSLLATIEGVKVTTPVPPAENQGK